MEPHALYSQWACEKIRQEGVAVRSLVNPNLQGHMLPASLSFGDCFVLLEGSSHPSVDYQQNWAQVTSSPPTTQRP